MIKNFLPLAIVALAAFAVSCQKEASETDGKTFTARIEISEDTKTSLNAENKVYWQGSDRVCINGSVYAADPVGGDPTWAILSKVSGAEPISPFVAVYPSSVYNGGDYSLPAVQTYDPTGIGNVPMYASSNDLHLSFKNICAIMKVSVPSKLTVKSVNVSSDLPMNGAFTVVSNKAIMIKTEGLGDEEKAVTLDCGEAGVKGTDFCIAVPAGNYTGKNLTFTVIATDGSEYALETSQTAEVKVAANNIYNVNFKDCYPVYREGSYRGVPAMIDGLWWAPVNCGYGPEYPYGKMYQWARCVGGGYGAEPFKQTLQNNVTIIDSQRIPDDNYQFITVHGAWWYGWAYQNSINIDIWPSQPGDIGYIEGKIDDPCPPGWHVPKKAELTSLVTSPSQQVSRRTPDGKEGGVINGKLFGDGRDKVFLPYAGRINTQSSSSREKWRNGTNGDGYYWTSEGTDYYKAHMYMISKYDNKWDTTNNERAYCLSVRCVHTAL